jgi:hypothetical protein
LCLELCPQEVNNNIFLTFLNITTFYIQFIRKHILFNRIFNHICSQWYPILVSKKLLNTTAALPTHNKHHLTCWTLLIPCSLWGKIKIEMFLQHLLTALSQRYAVTGWRWSATLLEGPLYFAFYVTNVQHYTGNVFIWKHVYSINSLKNESC